MLKVRSAWPFLMMLLVAFAFIPVAHTTLSPVSLGFPTMTQFTSSTVFNNAVGNAFDLEHTDISPFGSAGFGFPMVGQSAVQGQSLMQTEFAQNTVFSGYSYPAATTGIGFAGFNSIPGFGDLLL